MSDFLKKLRLATSGGPKSPEIAGGFNEILKRADEIAADADALKKAADNVENQRKSQKSLTEDEIKVLKVKAEEEEDRLNVFDKKQMEDARGKLAEQELRVLGEIERIKKSGGVIESEVKKILGDNPKPISEFSDDQLKAELERRSTLSKGIDSTPVDLGNGIIEQKVNLNEIDKIKYNDRLD